MSDPIRELLAKKHSKLNTREDFSSARSYDKYQDGGYYIIPIADIAPNPDQPRKYFDPEALAELTQSIKEKGILQPVIVRVDDEEKFHLVAGERRYRAAQKVGLTEIPAILTKGNPMEIALIENLQRDDLKPVEEAEALGRMIEEYNYTQEQLANVIGKAQSTISETLCLVKLPESIKEEVRHSNNYSRRLLVEITKQKTPEKMISLFNTVKVDNLKSNELRNITRKKSEQSQRNYADVMIDKIYSLQRQINKLSLQSLESEARAQIINKLYVLKRSIEEILD